MQSRGLPRFEIRIGKFESQENRRSRPNLSVRARSILEFDRICDHQACQFSHLWLSRRLQGSRKRLGLQEGEKRWRRTSKRSGH